MIVGFTNGCFDLLHEGHRHFLREVADQCDGLWVAFNTDKSVRELKGVGRPRQSIGDRSHNLRSYLLEIKRPNLFAAVHFETKDQLLALIELSRPDIIFKGSDYEGKEVVGSDLARVVLIPRLPGFSTTSEIEKRRA